MKIYKITQKVNNDYDTFDSAVVIAEDEVKAAFIHPNGYDEVLNTNKELRYDSWCNYKDVEVEYIGEAKSDAVVGVVVSSYNAG